MPFTSGGAELLTAELVNQLKSRGHTVDTVSIPFTALPKKQIIKQMAIWDAVDLNNFSGRDVDLVICTKFPNYIVRHPNKVCWLIHQHRQAYELKGTAFGDFETNEEDESLRKMILKVDNQSLRECKKIYTISDNVSSRLNEYNDLESEVLYPPLPYTGRYRQGEKGNYILSVGRICSIKRIDLMIESLANINDSLKLKIVGACDEPAIEQYLKSLVTKHHLDNRVEFLGRVPEEELLNLFANCFAVYYAPFDEDYGFVTLEALASGKIVITAKDSGGVLSFIRNNENGLIVDPEPKSMSEAFNSLVKSPELFDRLSKNTGLANQNSWETVIEKLTL